MLDFFNETNQKIIKISLIKKKPNILSRNESDVKQMNRLFEALANFSRHPARHPLEKTKKNR